MEKEKKTIKKILKQINIFHQGDNFLMRGMELNQETQKQKERNKTRNKTFEWMFEHLSESGVFFKDLPDLHIDIINWFIFNSDWVNNNPLTEKTKKILLNTKNKKYLTIKSISDNSGNFITLDKELYRLSLTKEKASEFNTYLYDKGWGKNEIFRYQDCPCFVKKDNAKGELNSAIVYTPRSWEQLPLWKKQKLKNKYKSESYFFVSKIGTKKIYYEQGPIVIKEPKQITCMLFNDWQNEKNWINLIISHNKNKMYIGFEEKGKYLNEKWEPVWRLNYNPDSQLFFSLYYDIINWFWDNSTEVNGQKINTETRKKLSKRQKNGFYPIKTFSSNGNKEFFYRENPQDYFLTLDKIKIKKLIRSLYMRGWPTKSIYRLQDCPGFYREAKGKDELIIFPYPYEWESLTSKQKKTIKNKYQIEGYCFRTKIGKNRLFSSKWIYFYDIVENFKYSNTSPLG